MNLVRKHTSKKPSAGTYFLGLVIGLLLGFIFLQMPSINTEVSREDAKYLTGNFQECDVDYRNGHIHSIGLTLSGAGKQFIHKSCVSSAVVEALSAIPTDTEMTLLVHPTSDYILEIQVNGQILLDFEHSQELLTIMLQALLFWVLP